MRCQEDKDVRKDGFAHRKRLAERPVRPCMDFVFLLIHSPLVSALTWEPTAEHLDALGCKVCVPSISNPIATDTSYFEIHRQQVLEQVSGNPREPYLVVGHSGAGALLPLLLQSLGDKARIVFVDSDLPLRGRSRFDLFRDGLADNWRGQAEEGNLPVLWTEEELTALITEREPCWIRQRAGERIHRSLLCISPCCPSGSWLLAYEGDSPERSVSGEQVAVCKCQRERMSLFRALGIQGGCRKKASCVLWHRTHGSPSFHQTRYESP